MENVNSSYRIYYYNIAIAVAMCLEIVFIISVSIAKILWYDIDDGERYYDDLPVNIVLKIDRRWYMIWYRDGKGYFYILLTTTCVLYEKLCDITIE